MIQSVNDTPEFNASLCISVQVSRGRTGKRRIYCELTYRDKALHETYRKAYAASKYDKVFRVFEMLNNYLIPQGEIRQAVENIR